MAQFTEEATLVAQNTFTTALAYPAVDIFAEKTQQKGITNTVIETLITGTFEGTVTIYATKTDGTAQTVVVGSFYSDGNQVEAKRIEITGFLENRTYKAGFATGDYVDGTAQVSVTFGGI